MIELERGANRVAEELDCTEHPWMPLESQILGIQCCERASVGKAGLTKDLGVVLLATLALLFTGAIGGKAIMQALYYRDLQAQIDLRLLEVTR